MRGGRCDTGLLQGHWMEPGQWVGICSVHGKSRIFEVGTDKVNKEEYAASNQWVDDHQGHTTPLIPDVKPKRRTRTG